MKPVASSTTTPIPSYITTNLAEIPYKAVLIAYIPMIAINYLKGTESTITLSLLIFGAAAGTFLGSKVYTNNLVKEDDLLNTLEELKGHAKISAVVGAVLLGIFPLVLRKLF